MWAVSMLDSGAVMMIRPPQLDLVETYFGAGVSTAELASRYETMAEHLDFGDSWRDLAYTALGVSDEDLDHFDVDWHDHDKIVAGFKDAIVCGAHNPRPLKVLQGLGDATYVTVNATPTEIQVVITAPATPIVRGAK